MGSLYHSVLIVLSMAGSQQLSCHPPSAPRTGASVKTFGLSGVRGVSDSMTVTIALEFDVAVLLSGVGRAGLARPVTSIEALSV